VNNQMKIAVLWPRLSGYIVSCLEKLNSKHDVSIALYHWPSSDVAPYDFDQLNWIEKKAVKSKKDKSKDVVEFVQEFNPDAVLMSGWMDGDYMSATRNFSKKDIPVISSVDNPWLGTIKQQFGRLISPFYLKPSIDYMWVPGIEQVKLAHRLGFHGEELWTGFYTCDTDKFSKVAENRFRNFRKNKTWNKRLLFVGRLIERKGVKTLIDAYEEYQNKVKEPWGLTIAGRGPMSRIIEDRKDINYLGFVQPSDIQDLYLKAGAFVFPSYNEHWGVVIHEATTSGLPVISTFGCLSTNKLLTDNYNGFLIESENPKLLSKKFFELGALKNDTLFSWGKRSWELAQQYRTELWADRLLEKVIKF